MFGKSNYSFIKWGCEKRFGFIKQKIFKEGVSIWWTYVTNSLLLL